MQELTVHKLPFPFRIIPMHLQQTARLGFRMLRGQLFVAMCPHDVVTFNILRARTRQYLAQPAELRAEWERFYAEQMTPHVVIKLLPRPIHEATYPRRTVDGNPHATQ